MEELIAAAGGAVRFLWPSFPARRRNRLWPMSARWTPPGATPCSSIPRVPRPPKARFDFTARGTGLIRSRWITRRAGQVATGRFFLPYSGIWPEGAQTVEVVLDVPFGPQARVTACLPAEAPGGAAP